MKDNVPSPYVIDPLIGDGSPHPPKKRKYAHTTSSTTKPSPSSEKDKDPNMTPFISEFPLSANTLGAGTHAPITPIDEYTKHAKQN